jgi:transcriptional regulator with XRE-family HTH domain
MRRMKDVLLEIMGDNIPSDYIIREARYNLDLTQDEVCEITGIKRPNLSALENGKIEMTQHYAEILAAVYGLHPADILYPKRNFQISPELKKIAKKAEKVINSKKKS